MTDILHRGRFRLSYGECDPVGIVYYAAYYPWMERVHTEWVIKSGLTQDENRRRWGVLTVCRASSCEYLSPGKLFDKLTITMRLGNLGGSSYTMVFDISNRSEAVARGTMTLVCVDDSGRPVTIPDDYLKHISDSAGKNGDAVSYW
jgi:acyl-CoA thioester hydrolase